MSIHNLFSEKPRLHRPLTSAIEIRNRRRTVLRKIRELIRTETVYVDGRDEVRIKYINKRGKTKTIQAARLYTRISSP